jgi:glycosyltransferase involved in cell wall biosynthesis
MPDAADGCPLLVFADDWGRHPSSCQHLIRRLLSRYPTRWVNTIGMRPPRLNAATFRRGWEKLRHWSARSDDAANAELLPQVLNPRMWPWFRTRFDRWLNRRLLTRALRQAASAPPIAITTVPITSELMGEFPVRRWVYYCVDDFTVWPGLDGDALRRMELKLIAEADVLIAVSETLQTKLAALGREAELLTHGVDVKHWLQPGAADLPPIVSALPRPLVVFWGVVDRRMDLEFVRRLGAAMQSGSILLVGPLDDPDPELLRLPRVVHAPPLPFDALPRLAAEASVLVMPYADLPVTRAIQPLKLKEYLATGKPVAVRDLPANVPWGDCLDLACSSDEFAELVCLRLMTGVPSEQLLARRRLEQESWDAKARAFERLILGDSTRLTPVARQRVEVAAVSC